ncbi:TRAP transporter small permease [Cohaesibacter celericrescens]|uniref:TRAP transporter small permease n=1 Tax=Cohaesibacter celericrescens TaxID=2067669 RepID=UPI003564829E
MDAFLKLERITTRIALFLGVSFLIIATILALYQVTTRFVFGQPSIWSETFTRAAMIWSVFLGISVAYQRGGMIAITIVQLALPPKWGVRLYVAANVMSLIFFAFLFWQGYLMTLRVLSQKMGGLSFSIAWAYAALPFGTVFTIIAVLACTVRAIRSGDMPEKEEVSEL